MKILHVSTGFPLSFPGGITNYVRALAVSQIASGDDVHVLARPEDERNIPAGVVLKPYQAASIALFSLKNVIDDAPSSEVNELIRAERYDIVHFHMSLDLPLGFLRDFPKLGVPYVVSLHDYFYICPRIFMVDMATNICREVDVRKCNRCVGVLDQVNLLRRAARKVGVQLPRIPSTAAEERLNYMATFLRGARLLSAVSNRTAEIYQNAVPGARIVVEQIGNESADVPSAIRKKSDKLRLTAMGTLSKIKGAEVLADLMMSVRRKDIEFHFYGRTFEGYGKRLRRLGMIDHGSYVPHDLPAIMAETDLGIVTPTWEDNGPQVAMEFINNRIPVLGTRRGGIPDIVSEGAGVLFDPDSKAEFEKAVSWLESITLAELSAISARMRRLKTPQEHARRMREAYEEVLQ